LKRNDIISLLLQLEYDEIRLKGITNYKQLLLEDLRKNDYTGELRHFNILNWAKNNMQSLKKWDNKMDGSKGVNTSVARGA
jgi:hypothetical protein